MVQKENTSKFLNWRLILIHLIATLFIATSLREFSSLSDINFIKTFDASKKIEEFKTGNIDFNLVNRLYRLNYLENIAKYLGVLLSFLISLIICFRNKWYWLNSLTVFFIALIFTILGWFNLKIIRDILFFPRELFKSLSVEYMYLLNGIILLAIGLVLIFSNYLYNFISKRNDD